MKPSVLELLSQAGIPIVKETSSNVIIKCLDKFHIDNHPSLSIKKETGQFQCWGCGLKGGYNTLYYLLTGTSYRDEEKIKEELQKREWVKSFILKERKKILTQKSIPDIKIVGNLYDPLTNTEIRKFLYDNGIEDDAFIRDRNITYSTYSEMIADHLINLPDVKLTQMQNRICSPIYKEGKLINVEGRTYKKETPKVLYVKGGSVETFYNLDFIDKTKDVIITEGVKGLWRTWNVNQNVIAMFHNRITDIQWQMLLEFKGKKIFFLDNDTGGKGRIEDDKVKTKGTYQFIKDRLEKEHREDYYWILPKKIKDDPNDCSYEEIESLLKKPFRFSIDPNNVFKERKSGSN